MAVTIDIHRNFGALLMGGLVASVFSGLVFTQTYLYYRLYPRDGYKLKSLVASIQFLDALHTVFVFMAVWHYLITCFGNPAGIDPIHWTISLTVIITAILTFVVHMFFAHRIFLLSHRSWLLTLPTVALATGRLVAATVTTVSMFRYGSLSLLKHNIPWIFTIGLALSSAVDISITVSLSWLLQNSRSTGVDLNAMIDTMIKYTFEAGALTCAGTIVSLICWLVMSDNLVFMGLHFVIAKLYANSLLVTLNTRQAIRNARNQSSRSGEHATPRIAMIDSKRGPMTRADNIRFVDEWSSNDDPPKSAAALKGHSNGVVEVNVERSVHYEMQ